MPQLQASELIITDEGRIYHLNLRPEELAPIVITVGDPGRVPMVSRYFDELEYSGQKREFLTHTGRLGKKRISVISTGIGTDNIDIVLNELDALVNISFAERQVKKELSSLHIIRLGTSGSLQDELAPDTIVASTHGLGLDSLAAFYPESGAVRDAALEAAFLKAFEETGLPYFYAAAADEDLLRVLGGASDEQAYLARGITLTSPGFYAPQGRSLRAASLLSAVFFEQVREFEHRGLRITNFEMETSAIYTLARMLGHRPLSLNLILANRRQGTFTKNYHRAIDALIRYALERIEQIGE